jgi:hypothetical protein
MTQFIYAKIDTANRSAARYLTGNGEIGSPCVPIYFDGSADNEEEFLSRGGARKQGQLFFECGRHPANKFIVVIYGGEVVVLEPAGPIQFVKSEVQPGYDGFVKLLPVREVLREPVKDVPVILAGINANRYYSSGTFREISDNGNKTALQCILDKSKVQLPHPCTAIHALECLSSVELETLAAKLFEELGCFVPAYRGGMIKDVDIFVHNNSNVDLSLCGITLLPKSRYTLQVKLKLRANIKTTPNGVDYLITGSEVSDPSILGASWLSAAIKFSPVTRDWLFTSLSWLPDEYLHSLQAAF